MTTLVFKTIRVGFPNCRITVDMSTGLNHKARDEVRAAARSVGADLEQPVTREHDQWVHERLVLENVPIVLCDTDMIFYSKVEDWKFAHPWAGALEPSHHNPISDARHPERLHTSLIFARPVEVRDRVREWEAARPRFPYKVLFSPYRQQWIPLTAGVVADRVFADTGALLYGAIGGQCFDDAQREAYSHLQCGTWSHIAGQHVPGLQESHRAALENPETARGLWREHDQWYAANPV